MATLKYKDSQGNYQPVIGYNVTYENEVVQTTGTSTTAVMSQDAVTDALADKADKTATVSNIAYDTTNKKITETINGTTTDVVTASQIALDGISNMTGASSSVAGTSGLVPAPAAGDQGKFLKGDGSWDSVSAQDDRFEVLTGNCTVVAGSNGYISYLPYTRENAKKVYACYFHATNSPANNNVVSMPTNYISSYTVYGITVTNCFYMDGPNNPGTVTYRLIIAN